MSDQRQPATGQAPTAEQLRRSLLDDDSTGDVAAILGVPHEAYVAAVVEYWSDPAREPRARVVDAEALKQQGYFLDLASLEELADWLELVAAGEEVLRPLTGGSFPGAAIASARRKARWITGGEMKTSAPAVSEPPRGSIRVADTDVGRQVKDQVARATTMVRTQRAALPPLPRGQAKAPAPTSSSKPASATSSKPAPAAKSRPATAKHKPPGRGKEYQDDPSARLKDRLAQLKEAYDTGLLTQAEYARKKRELMKDFGTT
ncbi:MAG: SHOCT domain-containing protein [Deltaproteobacteria bacterium]|nr:SHOCT domain-containing protein [Deltaproteobacteria bacterium]